MRNKFLFGTVFLLLLPACVGQAAKPTPVLPSSTPSLTVTPTFSPTVTLTPTVTATPTPLVIVFYGDSLLKVGTVQREAKYSYSFVDNLRPILEPHYVLITANYGGMKAKWAYENLDANVLKANPDIVTLWWGFNELDGCPGIFDRATDHILQASLDWYVAQNTEYERKQIDALLDRGVEIYLMTAMPITGWLPWSHIDPTKGLIWEYDRRCDYNIGLKQLAEAQGNLAAEYAAAGKPVSLVDVWTLYSGARGTENLYMDIMHPGAGGAALIADEWLRVFHQRYTDDGTRR